MASDSFSLEGQTALVIGGSGGIGRAIALGLAGAGARVVVAGRDRDKLAAAAAALRVESGDRGAPFTYEVDARSPAALARLAETIGHDHGRLHCLVNCQGVTVIKPAFDVSEEEYDDVLETNAKSVFFACTTFGRAMAAAGGGTIINVTSLAAHSGWAGAAAYCASKWAVAGLTQSFAAEWGTLGVRVNAIAPGFFLTDLNRDRMAPERKAEAQRRAAMKRMGETSELVGAAIFLASPAARFVTGATLHVDGGYLASGI
ncbi:MAG: 2-deoxy-D-gluconate 3-dehydrogenase [Xanthobacteraceae bacterium]|jgi:NAD(P)-dependent dehydrogenase (short-subunit alcohol dehydrogenase family)|nr:2-deoxy-D-gluconate 3-dehydrogenase [Xanthobacteraceae bacterium]